MATTMGSTTTTTRVSDPASRRALYWGIAIVLAIILAFAFARTRPVRDVVSPTVSSQTVPTYNSNVAPGATRTDTGTSLDSDLNGSTVNDSRSNTDLNRTNPNTNPAVSPDPAAPNGSATRY